MRTKIVALLASATVSIVGVPIVNAQNDIVSW